MKKKEIFLLSTLTLFLGVVCGFLLSPTKNGVYIIAGDTNHNKASDEEEEQIS